MGIIYKATNTKNGKTYIGKTARSLAQRQKEHLYNSKNPTTPFHYAIAKHGEEIFEWEILFKTKQDILTLLERLFIITHKTYKNGYNATRGGEGTIGWKHPKSVRQKMSTSSQGNGALGFVGAQYRKNLNCEKKCWNVRFRYKKNRISLGYFEDPVSAQIIYKFAWNEIYKSILLTT